MTRVILYTSEDGKSEVSVYAPDHFRGVTKLIAYGKRWANDRRSCHDGR